MDFDASVRYMQGRLRLGVKLGNDRFLALLELLGNPQDQIAVIHIAGTKGKGSTATMVASILRAAGKRTGLYLSPFVYDMRERIQIDGEPIPKDEFARLMTVIRPHVEALEQTEFGATTEFELKTAVGFLYFAQSGVDCAVIEVGLGGRLDATNVVRKPLTTVITNIDLDHTELLGDTPAAIAAEKAGILKPGIPCVTGVPRGTEAYETIAAIAAVRGVPLLHAVPGHREDPADTVYLTGMDGTLTVATPRRALSRIKLRLGGAFQNGNAALAVAALDSIPEDALAAIPDSAVIRGLETAYLPGRFERVSDNPVVVVDVAHNELSARVLAQSLTDVYAAGRRRLILVVGLSKNHAPETFLPPLLALRPVLVIATEPSFHPRNADEIADAARASGYDNVRIVRDSVHAAVLEALRAADPGDVICLTGSFYTVGDIPPSEWPDLIASGTRPLAQISN